MKQLKGFAVMDPVRHSEIARQGGKAAHAKKVAHVWTKAEARLAGHKGGLARARNIARAKAKAKES